jgi:hypothetical protein
MEEEEEEEEEEDEEEEGKEEEEETSSAPQETAVTDCRASRPWTSMGSYTSFSAPFPSWPLSPGAHVCRLRIT